MLLHITEARYVGDYRVEVCFNDGRKGMADLADALKGPVFQALRDKALFSQLRVDKALETIVWPNGADLAPEYIYFQAFKDKDELRETFKDWGYC
ncbi:MAG: DUF2442 domain-containing protein [Thermodesulfobacteriota bacterium]